MSFSVLQFLRPPVAVSGYSGWNDFANNRPTMTKLCRPFTTIQVIRQPPLEKVNRLSMPANKLSSNPSGLPISTTGNNKIAAT